MTHTSPTTVCALSAMVDMDSACLAGLAGRTVASQERCKKPGRGLRSMRLMLCDGTDSFWWCRTGVGAALGQPGWWFEQRAA
jgi:hypothetical protein